MPSVPQAALTALEARVSEAHATGDTSALTVLGYGEISTTLELIAAKCQRHHCLYPIVAPEACLTAAALRSSLVVRGLALGQHRLAIMSTDQISSGQRADQWRITTGLKLLRESGRHDPGSSIRKRPERHTSQLSPLGIRPYRKVRTPQLHGIHQRRRVIVA